MACLIKAASGKSKGLLAITTQERDVLINNNRHLRAQLESTKKNYVLGLHHNWHDFNFRYDPLFDFSFAGEGDLVEVSGKTVPQITQDACNFVPDFFTPLSKNKFWDILYVARAVFFKKIPEFFQCIRQLYDEGLFVRVIFICPIPPYDPKNKKTAFYDIRKVYDKMFTVSEKNLFTLLTIDWDYPFPLDLETLSHFYKSSRVFVHFANDERRCRVAAYAWASGLPVVGTSAVGSLLPPKLAHKPYFYQADSYDQFPGLIRQALKESLGKALVKNSPVRRIFSSAYTETSFKRNISVFFKQHHLHYQDKFWALDNLGIRIARHNKIGSGPNTLDFPLTVFLRYLSDNKKVQQLVNSYQDPEKELEKYFRPYLKKLLRRD